MLNLNLFDFVEILKIPKAQIYGVFWWEMGFEVGNFYSNGKCGFCLLFKTLLNDLFNS